MKNRKGIILVALVVVGVLLMGTATALAAPKNSVTKGAGSAVVSTDSRNLGPAPSGVVTLPETIVPEVEQQYGSFTGKITDITSFYENDGVTPVEGKFYILVEDEDGSEVRFIVSDNTYIFNKKNFVEGDTFTGYYDATLPMLMIYPPQYTAEVAVLGELGSSETVKVDIFDGNLVSSDNALKLNIEDSTRVILPDGTPFTGKLENRRMAVLYGVSTRSIPAQTTPERIVVLPIKDSDKTAILENGIDVVVNGKTVTSQAYVNQDGFKMIPLKPVAEALGFTVRFNEETGVMTLGNAHTVTVGEDYYVVGRMAPIGLGAAPVYVNNTVYVPIQYFTDVLGVDSTGVESGYFYIND